MSPIQTEGQPALQVSNIPWKDLSQEDRQSHLREFLRSRAKHCISGYTPSNQEGPWGDDEWTITIVNNLWKKVPDSWHVLMDLHPTDLIRQDKEHEAFLRNTDKPVVVWEPQEDWPTSIRYPVEDVKDNLPPYFTNSISWELALMIAWCSDVLTDYQLVGIDMATGDMDGKMGGEYSAQRPSVELFIGILMGRGIRVHIPKTSDLLKSSAMYGIQDDNPLRHKLDSRIQHLVERLHQIENQHQQTRDAMNQHRGAIDALKYFRAVWINPAVERDGSRKDDSAGSQEFTMNGKAEGQAELNFTEENADV